MAAMAVALGGEGDAAAAAGGGDAIGIVHSMRFCSDPLSHRAERREVQQTFGFRILLIPTYVGGVS